MNDALKLCVDIEKAIRLLCKYFPDDDSLSKPTLFHSIRVGEHLYEKGYPNHIVIAGFLHDLLEDTAVTEDEITNLFGKDVVEIVKANTKNKSLTDRKERHKELISRCATISEAAAIVKAADILDNFEFYTRTKNQDGIEYCKNNAKLMGKFVPSSYSNPIFKELKEILN